MKKTRFIFIVLSLMTGIMFGSIAFAASGFKMGKITTAGSSCLSTGLRPSLHGNSIFIPGSMAVHLQRHENFKRGACQFALPIQVAQGYQLRLTWVSGTEVIQLSPQSRARTQIEIFQAGRREAPIVFQERSQNQSLSKRRAINGHLNILSECGQGLILRGNSAITLQSQGQARAAISNVKLRYAVESCR